MAKTKAILDAFLIALMVSGLAFVGSVHFGSAQSGTNVTGIINSDTTWTQANSPYNLTGELLVSNGATLTIEAGVTVNFYQYIMQVNGTLKAQGIAGNNVVFISTNQNVTDAVKDQIANINFGDQSSDDALEHTILNEMGITYYNCNSSIILNNDIFQNQAFPTYYGGFIGILPIIRGPGSATITNNIFTGRLQDDCSGTIANNTFTDGGADLSGGSYLISNNTFKGDGTVDSGFGLTISDSKAVVSDNYFSGFSEACMDIAGSSAWIQRNFIQNKFTAEGYPFFGIEIQGSSPVVENNTITNCNIGIDVYSHGSDYSAIEAKPTIINNNIYNNEVFNLYLGYPERGGYHTIDYVVGNIDASDNWWGTTDTQAINQTIRDVKDQSNLGTVDFSPFLTAPNPQATPNPDEPIPTILQIPTTTFLEATKDSEGAVELTINGNLTIVGNTMANVTANQSTATNINFTLMEDEGTIVFGNVTIPKSAVLYGTIPTIYIGNQKTKEGYTQDADNYYVWCTINFNSYYYGPLTIIFVNAPSFPTRTQIIIILVAVIVIATLTIILAYITKRQASEQKQIETRVRRNGSA
ncbi:MAG: right-handed parallel beta-helix repeat-containing protein [Candidatus Bathyarchaeia archaeon]|jgi:hypothetical protein